MTEKKITRRDFIKLAGLTSAAVPLTTIVKKFGNEEIVKSPELYGDFLVRRLKVNDTPYEVDHSIYKRFDQKYEMFGRSTWDEEWMASVNHFDNMQAMMDNVPGLSQEDMAFYRASWTVATGNNTIGGSIGGYNQGLYSPTPIGDFSKGPPAPPWMWKNFGYTDEQASQLVKTASKFYGASMTGIAELKDDWLYDMYFDIGYTQPGTLFRGNIVREEADVGYYKENGDFVIPSDCNRVIVFAFEMDHEGHMYANGPAAAATGNGYSRMAFTAACVSDFIRNLGYKAVPAGNSTGLSVPMAIDAGLGENSRAGLLLTPKYGPRVRISKVITNMPLIPDKPIRFGAEKFCEVCGKCAEQCPGGAISNEEKTWTGNNASNNDGTFKWYNLHDNCLRYWRESGTSCSMCISVCPFNKPEGWLHEITRRLIGAESGPIDQLLLNLDEASGFGKMFKTKEEFTKFYTEKENFIHIKD
jgi:epoxyqueuosine reductase